ncbi:VTT domain-containing protein [Algoriphagus sp. AGSA1]|uniref:DedA family protein n=1 Tax=Algoriphagus sp. AGSA1 TaxID=2907213 RepID=UPI001F3937C1|nr:VTT domain-containing protein [Algoriphagus sp. AGSA1]MCE7054978.1 VTT domain-containing protein [Algoriphagus sp. AGSA1]
MHEFLLSMIELLSPELIINRGGLILLVAIIFTENGVFFGFFLPGDSLLFLAGMLCGLPVLDVSIYTLVTSITGAAFLGYALSYLVGLKLGKWLLSRPDSLFFKSKYLNMASSYFEKRHHSAIIIGRFIPVVRTFLPLCLGLIKSDFRVFMVYNLIGSIVWTCSLVLAGYFLKIIFPELIDYLGWIIIGLLVLTSIPLIREFSKIKRDHV